MCATISAVTLVVVIVVGAIWQTWAERIRERLWESFATGDIAFVREQLDKYPDLVHETDVMFEAVWEGNVDVVELLLQRGADVNQLLEWGGTALHIAARYGTLDVVTVILNHGANIDDDRDGTPLFWAADQGRVDMVEFLLQHGAKAELVPLAEVGRSGFKPKSATAEQFQVIKDRLSESMNN